MRRSVPFTRLHLDILISQKGFRKVLALPSAFANCVNKELQFRGPTRPTPKSNEK